MYSFYPGPSALYPQVRAYLADAFDSGLLSLNHRSPEFMALVQHTVAGLRAKLAIPADYVVLFTSSATECWQVIALGLGQPGSWHWHNGAFGEKWGLATHKLTGQAHLQPFGLEQNLAEVFVPPARPGGPAPLICLTHCETSNGTVVDAATLAQVSARAREAWPQALVAVDATSSLGGLPLPWPSLDLVFGSAQKCLGLPAGLAVLVCSPRAVAQAQAQAEQAHYHSLTAQLAQMANWQTTHTPNVLGIYLLGRVMEHVPPIAQVAARLQQQAADWYHFLAERGYPALVQTPALRSPTVVAGQGPPGWVAQLKAEAKAAGWVLGNGYGPWKANTFRLANFPAVSQSAIAQLRDFLRGFPPPGK
ncbi:MAG: aminotransferase class V-fold PLP-dependent enzyme [Bernardetiaceae bacterium]|jgi:phosphoserine aminotransferase|nr:aminotransferase class V-fold PLP-dependent enzyme [Bernardetiaceae bacterium]